MRGRLAALLLLAITRAIAAYGTGLADIGEGEAVRRAFEYTGLGAHPDVTVSAEATTVPADDDVPFLRLAGKPTWRVTLDNVRLVVRWGPGVPPPSIPTRTRG